MLSVVAATFVLRCSHRDGLLAQDFKVTAAPVLKPVPFRPRMLLPESRTQCSQQHTFKASQLPLTIPPQDSADFVIVIRGDGHV